MKVNFVPSNNEKFGKAKSNPHKDSALSKICKGLV